MKRLLTFASAAALVAGTGGEAQAQARFDLGVYGGYTLSSPWIDHANQTYSIGPAPIFGLNTTFWTTPGFGLKFHAGYMPSRFPHNNNDQPIAPAGYPVNNYLLDLSAVFRPWMAPGATGLMSGMYFWAGGGTLVSNPAGNPPPPAGFEYTCVPNYTQMGICYSYQPGYATVGQATAGLGFDIFPLGPLGVFGELGAHGYSPPLHTTVPNERRDPFAVTGRGVLGVKLGIGDLAPPVVPVPPPPPPPPPAPPAAPAERQIQVCVVQNGQLQTVTATFRPATNDTVINNQAFGQVHAATAPNYSAGANWFIQQQEVTFGGRNWVPFGVTRIIQPPNLQRVGEFQGTPVFAEAGRQAPYEVVYVPVRPGCEFQPYQPREAIRPRG